LEFLETGLAAKEPDPPRNQTGAFAGDILYIVTLHPMIVTHPPRFPTASRAHFWLK
jgi:hypothetical protein